MTATDTPQADSFAIVGRDLERLLPRVLPAGWVRYSLDETTLVFDRLSLPRFRVLASAGAEDDGRRWLHLSVSKQDGVMPDWYALLDVRDILAGRESFAVQVFPPNSEHYSIPIRGAPDVAHLWVCLDGRPLPDFLAWRGGTL